MIRFTRARLEPLFKRFSDRTIMVIGDLMLDRYLWGRVSRISPEAPVPIVEIESESSRLGGAANVSNNVLSLGAKAVPVGVVGDDAEGENLKRLFQEKGFPTEGILVNPERHTTVKTRVIAHHQHVVRTDREIRSGISKKIQDRLFDFFESRLEVLDGIILEDYNKGLLVPKLIGHVIQKANEKGKMVFVNPKFDHFFEYRGATLFKPNRKEAAGPARNPAGFRGRASGGLEKTAGKTGMPGRSDHPRRRRHDPTGAGKAVSEGADPGGQGPRRFRRGRHRDFIHCSGREFGRGF